MARTAAKRKTTGVRSVERAIDILEAFSKDRPAMSVLEIQKQTRLSRPTLYRLLETLASRGLIRVHGDPQRFSLDYGVQDLAQNWLSGLDPVAAARPILGRLHEDTQETVALMMVRDQQSLCVLEFRSPHVLAISRGIGPIGHVARGATGKAILAFMDDKARDLALATLPKDIDKGGLLADIAKTRRDGFRVSRGEVLAGAIAVAAPYFDHAKCVVGSIGVFAPEARVTKAWVELTTARVTASAAELSVALGYPGEARQPSARRN
jgi:IclR family transcriptional regulator, acetate operon repressor